jgi:hypothetical protein
MACEAEEKEYGDANEAMRQLLDDPNRTAQDVDVARLCLKSADEAFKRCKTNANDQQRAEAEGKP